MEPKGNRREQTEQDRYKSIEGKEVGKVESVYVSIIALVKTPPTYSLLTPHLMLKSRCQCGSLDLAYPTCHPNSA